MFLRQPEFSVKMVIWVHLWCSWNLKNQLYWVSCAQRSY